MSEYYGTRPGVIQLGVDDKSTRATPPQSRPTPQHLPKFYIFGEWGDTKPSVLTLDEAQRKYGEGTFDVSSPYYNYGTAFAEAISKTTLGGGGSSGAAVWQRVEPSNIPDPAGLRLCIEVIAESVQGYQRDELGGFVLDAAGAKKKTAMLPGHKLRWVTQPIPAPNEGGNVVNGFGAGLTGAGTYTAGGLTSTIYPFMDITAAHKGSLGNNLGLRMWATIASEMPLLPSLKTERVFTYSFAILHRANGESQPSPQPTRFGRYNIPAAIPNGIYDRLAGRNLSIAEQIISNFGTKEGSGIIGDVHVYDDNVKAVLAMLHAKETPKSWHDHTSAIADINMLNIVGFTTSTGAPYETIMDMGGAVRPTRFSSMMMTGGGDGNTSKSMYEFLVKEQLDRYSDPNDEVQDIAINPESWFYDPGYPMPLKFSLLSVISIRKDLAVCVGTAMNGERAFTPEEDLSVALQLKSRYDMIPESTTFATPAIRAVMVSGSGRIANSKFRDLMPLTLEVGGMIGDMMGASNGVWNDEYNLANPENTIVKRMIDVAPGWIPPQERDAMSAIGLNYLQPREQGVYSFPLLRTIVTDTTSVLGSVPNMSIVLRLTKLLEQTGRAFIGIDYMEDDDFLRAVNEYFSSKSKGLFGGGIAIVPNAYMTLDDIQRGDTWQLPVTVYMGTQRRIMKASLIVRRRSDLQGQG
jgi:hypothetical protein